MTDDEKRRQKADMLLEYEDATNNLAAIRAKINTTALCLQSIAEWLQGLLDAKHSAELIRADFYSAAHAARINVLGDMRFREAMDYQQLVTIHAELANSSRRVEQISRIKGELGLR